MATETVGACELGDKFSRREIQPWACQDRADRECRDEQQTRPTRQTRRSQRRSRPDCAQVDGAPRIVDRAEHSGEPRVVVREHFDGTEKVDRNLRRIRRPHARRRLVDPRLRVESLRCVNQHPPAQYKREQQADGENRDVAKSNDGATPSRSTGRSTPMRYRRTITVGTVRG